MAEEPQTRFTFLRWISLPFFPYKDIIFMLINFLDRSLSGKMKASRTERESERRRWLACRRGYSCVKQECRWAFQSQFSNFRGFKTIFRAKVFTLTDFFHESSYKKFRTNFLSLTFTFEVRIWPNTSTCFLLSYQFTWLGCSAMFLVVLIV